MFDYFRKYRHFLAIGFMVFYLIGGLQFSVIECLHFLSHAGDIVHGKYDNHHFHSHQDDHQHTTLMAINVQATDDRDNSAPVNETSDLSVKKFPQIFQSNQFCLGLCSEKPHPVYSVACRLNGTEPAVPAPPPRA